MNRISLFSLAGCVCIADQLAKRHIRQTYTLGVPHPVIPGCFDLTYVQNTGGAFGILPNGTLGLAFAALIAIVVITFFTLRAKMPLPRLLGIALALPLGGALGNLLDRVRLKYVVDFVDWHIGNHYQWPVFNIADASICIGVGLLILYFGITPASPVDSEVPVAIEEK